MYPIISWGGLVLLNVTFACALFLDVLSELGSDTALRRRVRRRLAQAIIPLLAVTLATCLMRVLAVT